MIEKEWSERRDSNPRPLLPQSRDNENIERFQRRPSSNVFASFRIGSGQSAAKLWTAPDMGIPISLSAGGQA